MVNLLKTNCQKFLKWFGLILFLIVGLILFGFVYETLSERADSQKYLPPGRLIDVGGYRLHLNCVGEASPTVVIESGWGDSSSSWGWVQPEVAKVTRVCAYDRAGMGWSETSPRPRTAREFAKELHVLLTNANETGPFVLVGHSLGGYTLRVYAYDYPNEVAGAVFVDPQNLSKERAPASPAPKPGQIALPWLLARIGLVRLFAGPLGADSDLPANDRQAHIATAVTPRSAQTFLDEGMGMSEGAAQARAVTTLGKLPIIVLSRGKNMDSVSAASQERYLQLSTNSQHLVAHKSDHAIMTQEPDAVIMAIIKMVGRVREQEQQ